MADSTLVLEDRARDQSSTEEVAEFFNRQGALRQDPSYCQLSGFS